MENINIDMGSRRTDVDGHSPPPYEDKVPHVDLEREEPLHKPNEVKQPDLNLT